MLDTSNTKPAPRSGTLAACARMSMYNLSVRNDHSAPATGSILPAPLTPIVGRVREIDLASALLADPDVRLVTLTGPGGVGKTRLATHLAWTAAGGATDVHFLPLAGISDPDHILPALARAVGLRGDDVRPLAELIARVLRERPTLLVLDNAEQVIGAAPAISELLVSCPSLTALVTSRAPLRVTGEHELDVRPLDVPAPDRLPAAAEILRSDAVVLFLDRLAAIRPGFTPDEADLPVIAAICHHLDGLPLALELAAAIRHSGGRRPRDGADE